MQYMLYILDYETGEVVMRTTGTEQECAATLGSFMYLKESYPESFIGSFRFTRWGNRYAGEICQLPDNDTTVVDS